MKSFVSIAAILILLFGAIGWVCNIVALFGLAHLGGEALVRIAGIFMVPLGAILGYI